MRPAQQDQQQDVFLSSPRSNQKENKSCCSWQNRCCWYPVIVILLILAIIGIVQQFIIPDFIENEGETRVNDQILMKEEYINGTHEPYDMWIDNDCDDCPAQYFRVYIYNMTNALDVIYASAIPEFEELGPWVYRRFEKKTKVHFYDYNDTNGTLSRAVSYTILYDFVFQKNLSCDIDRHTSRIYTINFAMLGFINTVNWASKIDDFFGLLYFWDEHLSTAPLEEILYNSTVDKYIHGIRSDYVEDAFGVQANTTFFRLIDPSPNAIIEKTGKYDINNCRELIIYQNISIPENLHPILSELIPSPWNTSVKVAGSRETRQWAPFDVIGKNVQYNEDNDGNPEGNGVLNIWGTEKFRNVDYIFNREVTRKGLKLNRYIVDDQIWLNTTERPENHPYHFNLLPSGLLNITLVRGSPAFMSKGHFLGYDYYQKNVNEKFNIKMVYDGPDEIEDEQFFDMDTYSGIGFVQSHTYQINFHVITIDRPINTSFDDADLQFWGDIIPFARIEVRARASDETLEEVADRYKQRDLLLDISFYSSIGVPVACVILIGFVICMMKHNKSKNKTNNQYSNAKESGVLMMPSQSNPNTSLFGASADDMGYGTTK